MKSANSLASNRQPSPQLTPDSSSTARLPMPSKIQRLRQSQSDALDSLQKIFPKAKRI